MDISLFPTSRALTVVPGRRNSAKLEVLAGPTGNGVIVARTLAIGICGTDFEILSGTYGWAPPDVERLVIGHESIARVVEAPASSGLTAGDLIVGIVRRPDPVPCPCCAAGEWDMCRNGQYTERGIKELDGFAAEWIRVEPAFAVKVDATLGFLGVLLEPASVVAKAWDHVERIGGRARCWNPRTVLVTGAGPIGLLAALLGKQRGLDVHVFDRAEDGVKPALVRDLGGHYHSGNIRALRSLEPDIVIECTGAAPIVMDALEHTARAGIVCLAGVSSGGHRLSLDMGVLNRQIVLENDVVFGSVNANRSHYEMAASALASADRGWLNRIITRRVALEQWRDAFERRPGDVKVVLEFEAET
ncbi:threonine dehydrogenase-like Zn-dependent dehydrogenase [Panacagrimonas perspica]|uniref:Threonine dehydrogenase-like Zn-dependent dehydrogenase n=1 Tax=Panacagrimonas perspica TaxID=381431 RepID=A0A4R7NWJ4_9GAMM|nr:glucose 1-dehydrogenase [Panacagrimonas perspica]TDU25595.1 threonine dehydrogenase-like Zn-dependent dehydrogenase [Panacagrimonas perspica]THD03807.1 theronine dehydrogenase [Panacagrimonas perspica]